VAEIRFEPINDEIRSVTIDEDEEGGLTAVVDWVGKSRDTAKVLEFEAGVKELGQGCCFLTVANFASLNREQCSLRATTSSAKKFPCLKSLLLR
jgi:hypothetical protein